MNCVPVKKLVNLDVTLCHENHDLCLVSDETPLPIAKTNEKTCAYANNLLKIIITFSTKFI